MVLRIHFYLDPLGVSRANRDKLVNSKTKKCLPKLATLGKSLNFNSPMTWFWSSLGSIIAVESMFNGNILVIGLGNTFLGKN